MEAGTNQGPQFFVPQTGAHDAETAYALARETLKDQLRWPITDRRIFALKYLHDKKPQSLEVGGLEKQSYRYTVVAIFESSVYLVYTRAADGAPGVTILVNKDEVSEITDFA